MENLGLSYADKDLKHISPKYEAGLGNTVLVNAEKSMIISYIIHNDALNVE
jgi:hypothetical protein